MRDYPNSTTRFNSEVEKAVKRMVQLDLKNLRSDVIDSSNLHCENLTIFNLRGVSLEDQICLGLLSWFIPEEIGLLLRLDLESRLKYLGPEDRILCQQFLQSKAQSLIFLQETNLWHSRELFGNILKRNLDRFLKLTPLSRKLKRTQRKRGYDDKGSRVPSHRWLPRFSDILTNEQNQIEEKRQSLQDTHALLQGLII